MIDTPRIVFWILAGLIVAGAVFTVTRRSAVSAVVSLVGTFFALAALYTMLSAHFLAVIQVLIYSGAIMTLFVFVIMLLGRDAPTPFPRRGLIGRALGTLAALYLVYFLIMTFLAVPSAPSSGLPASGWGGVASVGRVLLADYLFPFEAVSLALLVAVIGAVVVTRLRAAAAPGETASDAPPPPPAASGNRGQAAQAGDTA